MWCSDRDERMVGGGPGLKYGFVLERPGCGGDWLPSRHGGKKRLHFTEVPDVIGAKMQPGSLPCPTGQGFQKLRLQQAVLVVPFFGPGIRKKHPDFLESHPGRHGEQELTGLGPYEMKIGGPGPIGFASRPLYPGATDIHPDAEFCGEFDGVALQEVTVSAAKFQDYRAGLRQE